MPGEGHGNPLQSSCLENPSREEPGGALSMGSRGVGHDWTCTHTVLEVTSPNSVCVIGVGSFRRCWSGICSLPLAASAGGPRCWEAPGYSSITQPWASLPCGPLPASVYVSSSPSCKDTGYVGHEPTLPQYDLILTNYICKDHFSPKSRILRLWVNVDLGKKRFNLMQKSSGAFQSQSDLHGEEQN